MKSRPQGFVLAGGGSRRMGSDKARLELEGQPLLLRTLNLLRPHVESVAVLGAAGAYDFVRDPIVPDRRPGSGPLAAILTGLEHARGAWSLFLACDLPLLRSEFLELLVRRVARSDADAVVPRTRFGWQPLCAAYRQTAIPRIRKLLGEGRLAVVQALPRLRVETIAEEDLKAAGIPENTFENVNRPEDWERILAASRARA